MNRAKYEKGLNQSNGAETQGEKRGSDMLRWGERLCLLGWGAGGERGQESSLLLD